MARTLNLFSAGMCFVWQCVSDAFIGAVYYLFLRGIEQEDDYYGS